MFKKLTLALGVVFLCATVALAAGYRDFFSTNALLVGTQTITGADTLTILDAGQNIFVGGGSGGVIALPAASAVSGATYKFQVSAAYDTANIVLHAAGTDTIEGTLIVAGAVVDCDAETQINFVADGENLGDYVEINSNGTLWLIGDSGTLTAAKMTCTAP